MRQTIIDDGTYLVPEDEIPEYVRAFYAEFTKQRAPCNTQQITDLNGAPITVTKETQTTPEDTEYKLHASRYLMKNPEEWSFIPDNPGELDVDQLINEIYEYQTATFNKEFNTNYSLKLFDGGDFVDIFVTVPITPNDGEKRGKEVMTVLPYESKEEREHNLQEWGSQHG